MPAADRPATLPEAFQRTARIAPDAVALRTVGDTQAVRWRDYAARVRQVAAGLAALGVGRGDTVALMMANRIEFYPLEVGAQHVGATSFSVYNTSTEERLDQIFANTGTRLVFCEHRYVERIKAGGTPVDVIVCIDGSPDGTISVDDLISSGTADFDFDATWQAVRPDDVATLIHTSGTTGEPKAVEATHTNLLFEVFGLDEVLGLRYGDRITSFLPTAHTVDRVTALYLHEVIGAQVTVVPDTADILTALADVRPTVWGAMPLLWEKLRAGIEAEAAARTGVKKTLGAWALGAVNTRARALLDSRQPGLADRIRYAIADKLVLSGIRAAIGLDRAHWLISGDAPIPRETLAFFVGLGLPMTEVWGMSELSGIATASHPRDAVLGSVGRPLPGLQTKVAADGEFLVRGPLVMRGYRSQPERTAAVIDADGWLHTGDIAALDHDGNVWIVDRKEELITNVAGRTMSPCHIEKVIKAECDLIGAMTTVGDARPYNTALIVLDRETALAYAARNGLADASAQALAADAGVIERIVTGVERGNTKLSPAERIERFTVLPVFWEPGGDEMTLTMKLKRRRIAQKYAVDIADLYSAEPPSKVHEPKSATLPVSR
ncbi:AMP-binding protein [Mycolicibacterium hippocampi]|uniref:Acyl-CoA synthetase n=1 Tax=Mycolicibacterium hippocampi TaxID=659824 RepID=A0A7I9ZVL2_9MYCO|nr:AMP-binding protein [Mycolicibacterium hippocampi]GFH05090.1 fatty-acid--CoA ligase [Mycolicibacterium hippocampi]